MYVIKCNMDIIHGAFYCLNDNFTDWNDSHGFGRLLLVSRSSEGPQCEV